MLKAKNDCSRDEFCEKYAAAWTASRAQTGRYNSKSLTRGVAFARRRARSARNAESKMRLLAR
eukprot:6730258-Lingulodinium_polyedra.AAC.1